MGGFLSAPVELIRVQRKGSPGYKVGVAEMQGWRGNHEDCHSMRSDDTCGEFFVLDGHGGDGGSLYGAPGLAEEFKNCSASGSMPEDARIQQGFTRVDSRMQTFFAENPGKDSGSTVIGMVSAKHADGTYSLKMLNCGDSRAIVVRPAAMKEEDAAEVVLGLPEHLEKIAADGYVEEMQKASPMEGKPGRGAGFPVILETIDHKPSHPTEKNRIEAAGGHVTADDCPRLDGNLAVSRGLGDFEYKKGEALPVEDQKVSCIPDIYDMQGLPAGTIVVLACDGVWDVMTGLEVADMVLGPLREDPAADLGKISADIVRTSLKQNSRDNVTAMVIVFGDGDEYANQKDEMLEFEKLMDGSDIDEAVKKQHDVFLKKCDFPLKPTVCDVCDKWLHDMQQCPCHVVHYCTKGCQKKGWKTHKTVCGAVPGNASPAGAKPPSPGKKEKGSKKK